MLADPVRELVELAEVGYVELDHRRGPGSRLRSAARRRPGDRGEHHGRALPCATRATWKAIEASVSTPVTRIRLPSRMPITNQLSWSNSGELRCLNSAL